MRDFLIVGGGVIGLSSALALRRAGASVAIFEAATVGAGASWAGGGILSLLLPWEYSSVVAALVARSAAGYLSWTDQLRAASGIDSEFHRSGMTVLAPFDKDLAKRWADHSLAPIEFLSSGPGDTLLVPDVAQVRNPLLIEALRHTALSLGVEIFEQSPIERLTHDDDIIRAALTINESYCAGAFVVCAGAWTPALVPTLATDIKPIRGEMLLFGPITDVPETIVYRDGVYLIPRRDGQVLVGSTRDNVGFDCSTTENARTFLSRAAFEIWPALSAAKLLKQWAGLRPMRSDNAPIIDRHPNFKNLFINAGHGRYGITMAPASAEILLTRVGLTASTDPLDAAFGIGAKAQLDKVQIVG